MAVSRIVGLEKRATAELVRMAQAYASECTVAGRQVPPGVAFIEVAANKEEE